MAKSKKSAPKVTERKIRYAVMGLGHIAQTAVLPAFVHAKNSELVALISEDPQKLKILGKKYKVPEENCYMDNEFPACLQQVQADVLYLCTPNDLHKHFAITALNEGIHVLCEKPLAITVEDCDDIIKTAEENGCYVMTAYRLHFEEANLKAIEYAHSEIGDIRIFNSTFAMQVKDKKNIRLNETWRGGGPVWDIGVYCINEARSLFRDEPLEVFAMAENNGDERFELTDEMVSVIMRFPKNRLASFTCSFGADTCSTYDLLGTKGRIHMQKAYDYASEREMTTFKDDKKPKTKIFKKSDQFAAELDYFSDCILHHRIPEPSAHEGRADIKVIQAILKSLDFGQVIKLNEPKERLRYPHPKQMMKRPPVKESKTIHVTSPRNN